ncbi:hypothetical protein [Streptomyces axinellae]|uniref:Lipoprotein n=1 Tax=Streptomyces axinellae TaxID=552788 RepID=A0ABP6C272_9ACTN
MRKAVGAAALVMSAVLLTGCGVLDGGSAKSDSGESASEKHKSSAKKKDKWGPPQTHEVTLEAKGEGTPQIDWMADTNHFGKVTLPWKKAVKVELKGAQLKLGIPLYITPQAVPGPDGQYVYPSCAIEVDGKQVAENAGGTSTKGCKYTLKGD